MGGSSSGGYSLEGVSGIISCRDLSIKTQLHSPNPAIISLFSVGAELDLQLAGSTGPCYVTFNGSIAGTILHHDLLKLIDCMQKGFKFIVKVKNISGGSCTILITTKKELNKKLE